MNPLISIVIPTHNRVERLRSLINNIVSYTNLKDVEIKIVANGCNDGTSDFVNSVKSLATLADVVSLIEFPQALGFNTAFNIGVSQSKGTYVIVLHDDVTLLEQPKDVWIHKLLEPMKDTNVMLAAPVFYPMGLTFTTASFFSVAFRRYIFEEIGGLDESFGEVAEADFLLRVWDAGYSSVKTDEVPVYHVPRSLSSDSQGLLKNKYGSTEAYYNRYINGQSDIVAHLPILKEYASKNKHITEFGIRSGRSSVALMQGKPDKLISYDIKLSDNIIYTSHLAKAEGLNVSIVEQSVLDVEIEPTDLLFIDSLHTYMQLSSELTLHGNRVKNNIILHDTDTFSKIGEDGQEGLDLAIKNFLIEQPEWYYKEIWHRNNGLTVLQRKIPNDKISFVFVSDNLRQFETQLKKIVSKQLSNCEVVAVINGFLDEKYKDILSKKVNVIWLEQNIPTDDARKLGIKAASGDTVFFLED